MDGRIRNISGILSQLVKNRDVEQGSNLEKILAIIFRKGKDYPV